MSDPYQVLGISHSASEDEVTQAYRKLAKKYHPDLNPGNKVAEQKMQEVNAAYDQIRTQQHGGATYEQDPRGNPFGGQQGGGGWYGGGTGTGGNPYGNRGSAGDDDPFWGFDPFEFFGGGQQQQQWQQQRQQQTHRTQFSGSPQMRAVHNFIANRQYQQAIRALMDITPKDGDWYYYSALANAGIGNRVTALSHAREAVHMDPANTDYSSLLDRFESGAFEYRQAGNGFGFDMRTGGMSTLQCCLAQIMCWTCCRPC